ncbi:hypothetical protein [Accumulibacter sp.]|uniref:hypothetical protein n=1 Tax=Accumulibacter sp. TaxID=2053492 RepID=UPI002580E238|nr:hypothetical protein [Accumulibacter sp.]
MSEKGSGFVSVKEQAFSSNTAHDLPFLSQRLPFIFGNVYISSTFKVELQGKAQTRPVLPSTAAAWRLLISARKETMARTRQNDVGTDRRKVTLNKQLGDAYDAQATELETACRQIEELSAQNHVEQKRSTELAQQLQETVNAKLAAESRATIAEQRAIEIDRRAADLRAELDLAHQDAAQVRNEVAALRAKAESAEEAHQEQRKSAAQEAHRAAERLAATQMERDEARKEIGKAREEASNWRGQVEALKEQQRGLLEAVKTGRVVGTTSENAIPKDR